MTTVLVSFGTTFVTLAAVAIFFFVNRRSGDAVEQQQTNVIVNDLSARIEVMSRELSAVLAHTEDETRRNRFLREVAGSIDLDEVLARTLDAASSLPGVDAVVVSFDSQDNRPPATLGLTQKELEEYAIAPPPAGTHLRAAALIYKEPREEGSIASGLAVPFTDEKSIFGMITVFSRSEHAKFDELLALELEALAHRAAPAIDNARRFREARQLADLDALTGLHNRRYFHETLAREVARAHRYNRRLALLVLDVDDFKAINDRIGHLAGDAALAELADRVREVVRSADIACRVGGDELGVILPEAALDDADQLYARIKGALTSRPIAAARTTLSVSAGAAELKADDTAITFFERADDALYRAKEGGKGRAASG